MRKPAPTKARRKTMKGEYWGTYGSSARLKYGLR
jgi:hypothetical protein